MEKETFTFNEIPKKNESFRDYLVNNYSKLKIVFPNVNFWIVEQFGKRASFIVGAKTETAYNPNKFHLAMNFYIFFCLETKREEQKTITNYLRDIYKNFY